MIIKCLSNLSYNGEELQKVRPLYENTLKRSGFKSDMEYKKLKG